MCHYRATFALGDFEAVINAISTGKSKSRGFLSLSVLSESGKLTFEKTGAMKPEGMITKKIRLDKVAEEGFKTLIEDKENHVKILVDVGAGI